MAATNGALCESKMLFILVCGEIIGRILGARSGSCNLINDLSLRKDTCQKKS